MILNVMESFRTEIVFSRGSLFHKQLKTIRFAKCGEAKIRREYGIRLPIGSQIKTVQLNVSEIYVYTDL